MFRHTFSPYLVVLLITSLTGCLEDDTGVSAANEDSGHAHCAARFHNSGSSECDEGEGAFVDLAFDFTVNSSENNFEINSGDSVSVTWAVGSGWRNCEVDPGNYAGNSGSFNSPPLTASMTYRISCVSSEGLEEKEIVVSVRSAPPGVGGPQTVMFRIPATVTTVNTPWNTPATAVNVKVGDTLQVFNDGTAAVQIHTSGGNPFNHDTSNIPMGGSKNYLIQRVCSSNPCPGVYNHNGAVNAGNFYINVSP